ncbi:MAG: metallopeptidase TldD-related protein [Myxococcota bacterium]
MDELHDAVQHALEHARKAGAYAADVGLTAGESFEARVRGAEIDFVKQSRERSLGVRVFYGGRGGLSSATTRTNDLTPRVIEGVAADAVALARATVPDPCAGLPDGGYAAGAPDLALFEPRDHPFDSEARIASAREAEAAARAVDPRIADSDGSQVDSGWSRIVYGNSAGFLSDYESGRHSLMAESLARTPDGKMQRDIWYTASRRLAGLEPGASVGVKSAKRALRKLGARRIPTCEAPVIFDPLVAPSLLRMLAGCLSGYSVYRGASFLASRMGERIAAPGVTIVDDGRRVGGLASRPFDGEGLPTRRNVLVDQGRLRSWLLDTYAARKLGLASTGSAVRGGGASTTNLWLEPGTLSPETIVTSTPRGLYVTELIGQGFNPVTGDYSRGASGLWIENSEIAFPVEEITIAGNLGEMLKQIDAIGNDLLWLGSAAAPTLRIARMTIAGS